MKKLSLNLFLSIMLVVCAVFAVSANLQVKADSYSCFYNFNDCYIEKSNSEIVYPGDSDLQIQNCELKQSNLVRYLYLSSSKNSMIHVFVPGSYSPCNHLKIRTQSSSCSVMFNGVEYKSKNNYIDIDFDLEEYTPITLEAKPGSTIGIYDLTFSIIELDNEVSTSSDSNINSDSTATSSVDFSVVDSSPATSSAFDGSLVETNKSSSTTTTKLPVFSFKKMVGISLGLAFIFLVLAVILYAFNKKNFNK